MTQPEIKIVAGGLLMVIGFVFLLSSTSPETTIVPLFFSGIGLAIVGARMMP